MGRTKMLFFSFAVEGHERRDVVHAPYFTRDLSVRIFNAASRILQC